MKSIRFFVIFLFSFLICQNNHAQLLKNERAGDNNLDSIIIRVLYSFRQKNIEDISKIKVDTMALDIGSKWSKYYDPSINKKDSIRNNERQNIKSLSVIKNDPDPYIDHLGAKRFNGTVIKSDDGISYIIYKNRFKNEIYTLDRNTSGVYVLLTENLSQDWALSMDTCRILGYFCQKATTFFRGREYEVFFTQDVPLNDGPFKFYGLPGLIMKVNSKDGLFSFEAIGLQTNNEVISFEIDHRLEVCKSLKQYHDFLKSKSNNAFVGFITNGNAVLYKSDPNKGFENIEIFEE